MNSITIELSIPAHDLWPNARPHWRVKWRAVALARRTAYLSALEASGSARPGWAKAVTTARFYFATRRNRDRDGAASSLKAYWDGIADAGIVANDSGLSHTSPEFDFDSENPRVVLTVTKQEGP